MLNPLLLWFLPLALVPIVLHLLTLYRVRTVELSTFRFLMESYMHQRRRLRFLEWLLMLLRVAFILLIIFMLSRPMIERLGPMFTDEPGRDVVIIIDAGATMALQQDGTTALDRARLTADHVADLLEDDDHVTLIRAGREAEVLHRGLAAEDAPLRREIEDIQPDVTYADLPAAFAELADAPRRGPRIVYLLTDAQRRTVSPLADHAALGELSEGRQRLVVMNFGPQEPVANLAVIGDPPQTLRPIVGLPVILRATVSAAGHQQPVDTRLSLKLGGEVYDSVNVTLQPGERISRRFVVTPEETGVLRGRFEVPGDDFPDDDAYLFTLNVEPRLNVLLITPEEIEREHDPRIYLGAALRAPQRVADDFAETDRRISRALEIDHVSEDELSRLHLDRADVVIAADILIDERRGEMLHAFVSGGGGLMLLPGARSDVLDYNVHLLGETMHERRAIAYRGATGDVDDESTFQPIDSIDHAHPVFSAFARDDRDGEEAFFSTVRLFRHYRMAVGEATDGYPRVLMHSEDGRPLLAEHRIGAGRLLAAGFAATPGWSNLPLKPEFVPVLLRSVAHLRRPAEMTTLAAVRPHEPAPISLSGRYAGGSVELIDPDDHPHAVPLRQSDGRLTGAAEQTGRRGYYTFHLDPPADATDADREAADRVGFAVNYDLEDAAFDTLSGDELTTLLEPAEVVHLQSSPDDPVLAEQLNHRREMWRTLIWITFGLIALEFALSTLRGNSGEESTGGSGLRGLGRRITARLDRMLGLDRGTN